MLQTLRKSELPMYLSVPALKSSCIAPLFRALRRKSRTLVAVSVAAGTLIPAAFARQGAARIHAAPRSAVQKPAVPDSPVLLDAMTTELHRAFASLAKSGAQGKDDKQVPPYFLSYSVGDAEMVSIRAQYGALVDSSTNRVRVADVQVRLGDPKLDNTHGNHRGSAVNSLQLPLVDDRQALGRTLWLATNTGYSNALDNYMRV